MFRRIALLTALAGGLAVAVALQWHAVSRDLTPEDRQYLAPYLKRMPLLNGERPRSVEEEVRFIEAVQDAVLSVAPRLEGLPPGRTRELKDLVEMGIGLCYDRSRAIEQILRGSGFETRHVSMYATVPGQSSLRVLLTPGAPSHAVSEVLTARGWVVVDPNDRWISVDAGGNALDLVTIHANAESGHRVEWKTPPPNAMYEQPFTYVYGLYSRHGQFYPPYDFIPDVNYEELASNVW